MTLAAALSLPAAVLAQPVRNGPLPTPLPLFPPDNWWNVDVTAAPIDPNSANFINFIGATVGLHPDFGGDDPDTPNGIFGFPYAVVPGTQPLEPVAFQNPIGPGPPSAVPVPVRPTNPAAPVPFPWFQW